MATILIANIGSASKKYALYDGDVRLFGTHFEHEGNSYVATWNISGRQTKKAVSEKEYARAAALVVKKAEEEKFLTRKLDTIGIRVVAPGIYFTEHRLIDSEYVKKLEAAAKLAPLHATAALAEIKELRKLFPGVPLVGASDSAFHKTMPETARRYALPEPIVKKFELYRYGYHGLSFASAARKLAAFRGGIPKRTAVCHLGSGSSITALRNGESIDTTMGFTPLEGLPMTTRSGSVDPGAIIFLEEKLKLKPRALEKKLNNESGLLGVSQLSSDIRELLKAESLGDKAAALALGLFVYHIRKQIGAMAAVLGGLDALVFTGTVGERSDIIRERVVEGLGFLKLSLSHSANDEVLGDTDASIGKMISHAKIYVLTADEAGEIAQIVNELG